MRTADAERYVADRLSSRWANRLDHHGWQLQWSRSRAKAGSCTVTRHDSLGGWVKRIVLSQPIVKINSDETIWAVINHEIAHAIAYEYGRGLDHHDWWRDIARAIGGDAAAVVKPEGLRLPRGKYRYRCPQCGTRTERVKKVAVGYEIGCRPCRRGRGVWVALQEVKQRCRK